MMKISTLAFAILLVKLLASSLQAQSRGPSPINLSLTAPQALIANSVLVGNRPGMLLGWNWGAGPRQMNIDMHTNVWHAHNPLQWTAAAAQDEPWNHIAKAPPGTAFICAPSLEFTQPYKAFDDAKTLDNGLGFGSKDLTVTGSSPYSLHETMGIRFQPEITVSTSTFTPRSGDQQGSVFGFTGKNIGTLDNDPTNTNTFHRFALDEANVTTMTPVLSGSWPSESFCEWRKGVNTNQAAIFNGQKMYLAVNVRRNSAIDIIDNDNVVLKLRVFYQLVGTLTDASTANDNDSVAINFDSIPHPSFQNVALPLTFDGQERGVRRPLSPVQDGVSESQMFITRRMIPRTDVPVGQRDATILAHFTLDAGNQSFGTNYAHQNPHLRDRWQMGKALAGDHTEDDCIYKMWVIVEYAGECDIAIDWVELGTDQMVRTTCGYFDNASRDAYMDVLTRLNTYNTTTTRTDLASPNHLRVWKWYSRDEGPEAHWEGMRYFNQLFDNNSISETQVTGLYQHFRHITGFEETWQGVTPVVSVNVGTPYYRTGSGGMGNGHLHQGVQTAIDDIIWPTNSRFDYDLHYGSKEIAPLVRTTALPVDTNAVPVTQPLVSPNPENPQNYYPFGPWSKSGGLQLVYEQSRYTYYRDPEFLFDSGHPWLANVWITPSWDVEAGIVRPMSFTSRCLTGEEAKLIAWSSIILGAKGLLYYWGGNPDSAAHFKFIADELSTDFGISYDRVKPTWTSFTWTGVKWEAQSQSRVPNISLNDVRARNTFLDGLGARDIRLGPDYLNADNCTGLFQAINSGTSDVAAITAALGVPSNRFYLGWQSTRSAIVDVNDVIHRGMNELEDLHLKIWYNKGFRSWAVTDPASPENLATYLDVARLRSRHPHRDGRYPDTLATSVTWESWDSTFVEMTILQDGTTPLSQRFVVGVLNRRCNPYDYWAATGTDYSTFRTYEENRGRAAAAPAGDKSIRYGQNGARQIRIPFNFSDGTGRYRLLRIRSIGELSDPNQGTVALDTVIGQNKDLIVDFLPGEGKMLMVEVIPSEDDQQAQVGFLNHSNQRKIVAFPEVDDMQPIVDPVDARNYLRIVVGDQMWYHQVYHKRKHGTSLPETGPLAVYYRRSVPLRTPPSTVPGTQYVFDAGVIQWEAEQVISDRVLYDPPGPIPETLITDLSCGYPALVVRPHKVGTQTFSRVYVVFGCEYPQQPVPDGVLVCETVIPAEDARADQMAYYADPVNASRVLDYTPAPIQPALEHWGTPMINASQNGNFYCWSHATFGIGVGFKEPIAREFVGGQKMYIKARNGFYSTHPSLNSYSRLHIGEPDASLVWQEGLTPTAGSFIFYTRLFHGPGPVYQIQYRLNVGTPAMRLIDGAPFVDPINEQIGEITRTYINVDEEDITAEHAYPVVYRHLSDWMTTSVNSRHYLRLVNHKADRVFWQSREVGAVNGYWMIGRRALDFSEWSQVLLNPKIDILWSIPEQFIYSGSMSLLGPDVSQGEQWGELGSVPNNPLNTYQDSTSILNFWSQTDDADISPSLWHMMYGWSFYGAATDHLHSDLVSSGLLTPLHATGKFPHLAARYSVSENRGIQRSRRVYNRPGGNWVNHAVAPFMRTSSEEFYKPTSSEASAQAFVYSGFRARGRSATVSPIYIESTDQLVQLKADVLESADSNMVTPRQFHSDWVTFSKPSEILFLSNARGYETTASLFIERELDGVRVDLEALAASRQQVKQLKLFTITGGKQNRFRFVLTPTDDDAYATTDIEVIPAAEQPRFARQQSSHAVSDGWIDLSSMTKHRTENLISAFPSPSDGYVNVSFAPCDTRHVPAQCSSTMLQVTNSLGTLMGKYLCESSVSFRLNATEWPSGLYFVTVSCGDVGAVIGTTRFVLLH